MRGMLGYWVIGCALVGWVLPKDIECHGGRFPRVSEIVQAVSVWPVAVFAGLLAPEGFRFHERCEQPVDETTANERAA